MIKKLKIIGRVQEAAAEIHFLSLQLLCDLFLFFFNVIRPLKEEAQLSTLAINKLNATSINTTETQLAHTHV